MSESSTEIRITLKGDSVHLESTRTNRLSSWLNRRDASDIIALMPSLFALCPAAHICAFTGAFETAESGLGMQSISILTRIEAVLETIRFFSMDLRKSLGLGSADRSILTKLSEARVRLLASLQGQTDSALMSDTAHLARLWLATEVDLFKAILDRSKEIEQFTLPTEAVLQNDELTNAATLSALSVTLRDCPQFALAPRLGGARVVGAVARRLPLGKKLISPGEIFHARINEIAALISGKSSLLGNHKTFFLGGKRAVSLVETARGVLMYFVERDRNTPVWVDWIAPTEWVFQPQGILTTLVQEAFQAGASREQIAFIAAAFDACAEVIVTKEQADA